MKLLLALAFVCVCAVVTAAPESDRINNLPGWSGTTPMYSGYLNVDEANGRNLFYWHVQSTSTNPKAPVVLWLNGGPGCSSVGGGLMSEMGPFVPSSDGTLTPNVYSWHNVAHMIYIESPAGVGFSYSNTSSDYVVGDNRTATDVYHGLLKFFDLFPELKGNEFMIATESYGHYGPTTSLAILQGNAAQKDPSKIINLSTLMVGNGWTVAELDNTGAVEYWTSHGIVARSTGKAILDNCNMSDIGPLALRDRVPALGKAFPRDDSDLCDKYVNEAMDQFNHLNIYDVFADVCTSSTPTSNPPSTDWSADVSSNSQAGCSKFYRPCVDDFSSKYLNRADVQAAIHVQHSMVPAGSWSECSRVVDYSRFDLLSSMLPVYKQLFDMKPELFVHIYSGDIDAIVPYPGTQNWLELFVTQMGWSVTTPNHAWLVHNQVGGFATKYGDAPGIEFTTVRGAGHMVPQGQQARALEMFTRFVNHKPL